jgi:Zn finger protein HypA/HybF involved in hydrogenase expression
MAIIRCSKCAHVAEVPSDAVGRTLSCPQCGHPNTVYDTVFFVRKVLEKYLALQASLKRVQAEADNQEAPEPVRQASLDGLNLYNTDQISTDEQYGPVNDWFQSKQIQIRPDHRAVDTTGFFDEVGVEIGRNYELLKAVVEQIRHGQHRGYTSVHVNLGKRSQKEAEAIAAFCRQLYDYSFVSRFFYQKPEKVVRLTLQGSSQIHGFFAGEWLEWFAMMQVLEICQERRIGLSLARKLSVVFPNEDLHELDLFCILNGKTPLCIECKTGEFRQSIDKYVTLRRRLGLEKDQFVICVVGLSDEQGRGLSSMYDLTFVGERGLGPHLGRVG